MSHVIVVGAGVVGLTCAFRLLEAGHHVEVVARELPARTTSATAAALWYPYLALPPDRVTAWAARSREVFGTLAADEATGVRLLPGTEVFAGTPADPWWRDAVPDLARTKDVPPLYATGWTFTAPVVDMPVYLRWLAGRIVAQGGSITQASLDAMPDGETVVDCTGLGARETADDETVTPVRGQVVYVEQWGLEDWWLDATGPTYVIPRLNEVVVGGTEQPGSWDPEPDPATAVEILDRAARLVPEVAHARVLRHGVGLRPARPQVRLERDAADPRVVRCYGHGGAGVTLSWGCADEVAELVARGTV